MQFHLSRSRASVHSLLLLAALAAPLSARSQIVADSTRHAPPSVIAAAQRDTARANTIESRAVRSVRLISSYQLERERLGELAGDSQVTPISLRSVSAYITRVEPSSQQSGIFFPELELV